MIKIDVEGTEWMEELRAADASSLSNEQLEALFKQLPPEWEDHARKVARCLRRRAMPGACPGEWAFPPPPKPRLSTAFAMVGQALESTLKQANEDD